MSSTTARASSALRAQCTWPPAAVDVALVQFEVEIEMGERVVLDRASLLAQRLEFRQTLDRLLPGAPETRCAPARAHAATSDCPARRGHWPGRRGWSAALSRFRCTDRRHRRRPSRPAPRRHAAPRPGTPRRVSLPAMFNRHPRSPASTASAPVAAMSAALSPTILSEISGYLTQNVPPKPQHSSAPGNSRSSSPPTVDSSRRGCALTPSSRKPGTAHRDRSRSCPSAPLTALSCRAHRPGTRRVRRSGRPVPRRARASPARRRTSRGNAP